MATTLESLRSELFRKVDDCVYDMRTGRIGVKLTGREGYTVFIPFEGEKYNVEVVPFDSFSCPVPAFAMRTPLDKLKLGDVVYLGERRLYFTSFKKQESNTIISGIGVQDQQMNDYLLPTNMLFPQLGVLSVKNTFGTNGNDFSKMLPFLVMSKTPEDAGKMMAMMSLTQGEKMDMNAMFPFLAMQKGGDSDSALKMMALAQMGGESGSMSNMLPLFFLGQ
jgi:hypothetical protein